MYEKKIEINYKCGVLITSEIISGKWKACLLNRIHEGLRRPNELQRAMPDASRRALNMQLNELEQHGIIKKEIFPVLPPKVEYSLTKEGESLLPVLKAMESWGLQYREKFLELVGKPIEQSI